jgi:hypothetical protein
MNFTGLQKLLLGIGVFTLIFTFSGLGISFIYLTFSFCIICIALCYRNWWSDEQKKYDKTVG